MASPSHRPGPDGWAYLQATASVLRPAWRVACPERSVRRCLRLTITAGRGGTGVPALPSPCSPGISHMTGRGKSARSRRMIRTRQRLSTTGAAWLENKLKSA